MSFDCEEQSLKSLQGMCMLKFSRKMVNFRERYHCRRLEKGNGSGPRENEKEPYGEPLAYVLLLSDNDEPFSCYW